MCEECKTREDDARKQMVEDANRKVDWRESFEGLDPETLAREDRGVQEAIGLDLESLWMLYDRMLEGGEVTKEERIALAKWITLLVRTRAQAMTRISQLNMLVELAGMALRAQGVDIDSLGHEKKELLH